MKKRILFFIAILILSYSSILIGYANQVYPKRIISLGPSLTKELYLLEVEDRLIGCTIYAPECAKNKEKVGTVIDINLERIIKLKPDLVLATSLVNPKQVEKLRKLKIKVVVFHQARSFQELCDQFLELAKLVGKQDKASQIIKEVKEKVKSIREKTKDLKRAKVFIQVGAKPLFTAGKNSFVNDFIEFAGGINIAKDTEIGIYSREKILEKNPDVIIICLLYTSPSPTRPY